MKTLIITALFTAVTFTSYANFEGEEKNEVTRQDKDLAMNEQLFETMDYTGEVQVTFTVDEQDRIQITEVDTDDFSLEYHIRKSLQNAKVAASESMAGRTLSFVIDFVSSK
jgi:hypothetical protein